jgi:hypothetical protein
MNAKSLVTGICAAAVLVAAALPVTAATNKPKKQKTYDPYASARQAGPPRWGQPPGTPHTCGHFGFLYDDRGVPMGPYCH